MQAYEKNLASAASSGYTHVASSIHLRTEPADGKKSFLSLHAQEAFFSPSPIFHMSEGKEEERDSFVGKKC